MRVSVIIPAYRAAHTIGRALNSVLAQSHPAHEIIVVDDGSPDDVASAVSVYGDRVTLLRQPNGGAASARNRGIDHATGDFVAFLDADDYWEPHKLAEQLAVFERIPQLGLLAGAYYRQEAGAADRRSPGANLGFRDRPLFFTGYDAFCFATSVWTGSVLVRREVLGDERFISGLEPAEDRDLWMRLTLAAPVYWMSLPLSTLVLEPNSLSRSNLNRDCTNMLQVVDRHRRHLGRTGALKWRSRIFLRWAANEPSPVRSLGRLAQSVACWPLPLTLQPRTTAFARPRLLAVSLLRMMGVRSDRPGSS